MTTNVPAKLKTADITRFAVRAAQLEKIKPVVAYWCEYYIVQQILSKNLHQVDQECLQYTTTLMDKLEQTKNEHSSEDAIMDEVAAQAYCEQFALDTFQRADNAVRANKASVQTAETFRAAATFLDMLANWGAPTQEIMSKSKYAKYHAIRIAKALKAGEDPNLSNPVQESTPEVSPAALDPNDPEVQRINGTPHQPYVEDDNSAHPSPALSASRVSPPPPTFPSAPSGYSQRAATPPHYMAHRDVSPISPQSTSRQGSVSSVGGGYFPRINDVPTFTADNAAPGLPTAPVAEDQPMTSPYDAPTPAADPKTYYRSESRDVDQNKLAFPTSQPQAPPQQPPRNIFQQQQHFPPPQQQQQQPQFQSQQPNVFHQQHQPPMVSQQSVPYQQEQTYPGTVTYNTSDEAIIAAQKHAKWAVSALNFEDVETAVKELRIALRSLGAS